MKSDFQRRQSAELSRAKIKHGQFASLHEGYAVLLEEMDEVWLQVKRKEGHRDLVNLYAELIQVAAMAEKMSEIVVAKARLQK